MNFDFLSTKIQKEHLKRHWREILLGVLIFTCGVLGAHAYILTQKISVEEGNNLQDKKDLAELKIEVETLIAASAENTKTVIDERLKEEQAKIARLESSLSSESEKRAALEDKLKTETGLSSNRLSELEKTFSTNYDLTSIIGTWRKRTANITCYFGIGTSRGSGILSYLSNGNGARYGVLTNQHVVTHNGRTADSCTVTFPDDSLTFTATRVAQQIELSTKGQDFARILIPQANAFTIQNAATEKNFCSSASTGDELVILGYPAIGSGSDITATEGIVSGREGDYFITSAKVEQGNSGGSAVLLRGNCLLGIPTFVQLGNIEALARILNIQSVLN